MYLFYLTLTFASRNDLFVAFRPDLSHLVRLLINVAMIAENACSDLKTVANLLGDLDSLSLREVNEVILAWHPSGMTVNDGLTPLAECRNAAKNLLESAAENLSDRLSVVLNNLTLGLILLFRHCDVYLNAIANESKIQALGISHESAGKVVKNVLDSVPDSCIMQLHHYIVLLSTFAEDARFQSVFKGDDVELASSLLRRIRKLTGNAKNKLETGQFGMTGDFRFRTTM